MRKLMDIKKSSAGDVKATSKIVGARKAFSTVCNSLLVRAYKKVVKNGQYQLTWEEDTFTANMYSALEQLCQDEEIPCMPLYQEHQLTKEILAGEVRPLTAKKIDIVFASFFYNPRLKYRVEAKILSEQDTNTRNAKHLAKEYVISGIDRFVRREYQPEGCIVGYIINGSADAILAAINLVLTGNNRNKEILNDKHLIEGYEFCYNSKHEGFDLKHLLFHFA